MGGGGKIILVRTAIKIKFQEQKKTWKSVEIVLPDEQ